jgi:uncharacterized repeat protein (TIGR01451 family)
VRNFYKSFSTSQQFQVQLCDTNNNVLAVAFTTNPGDPLLDNWIQKSYDLTPFVGQKLRVRFWVNPGMYFLDVHLDSVSVQVGGTTGSITNDVYFGTNPTPGPAEFKGSTTNSSWTLPLLSPLTTYYWQIVAHKGGTATGPVWQFTTRGVDHFVWSPVSSPQVVNQPFSTSITAKDTFNTTVSNFNGTVSLQTGPLGAGGSVIEDFESGIWPHTPWVSVSGGTFGTISSSYAHDGNYGLRDPEWMYRTNVSLGNIGDRLSWWVRPASGSGGRAYLGFGASAGGCWSAVVAPNTSQFMIQQNSGYGFATVTNASQTWQANKWYLVTVQFVSTSSVTCNLYDSDGTTLLNSLSGSSITGLPSGVAIRSFGAFSLDTVASDSSGGGSGSGIPISPTNSGNFVNGAWSGNITALQLATNVVLRADDGSGHTGSSNPFDVTVTNDISISILDSPDPVSVGVSLTYTLTVANTGPSAATGVSVTNLLPASAAFISAISSQGTCTQSGGVVTCDLGVVSGGTNATIAIVVVPTVAGTTLTNSATVSRVEVDPYLGNNAALVTTVVTTPAISIADASLVEGNVGTTNMVFTLTLAAASAQTITVNYATANGGASAGSDYVGTNGILIFPPGTTNGTITVAVIGDTLIESNETFFVNLSNPVNGVLGRSPGVGTIVNDDGFPGQVDHFTWSVIASPQYTNMPFGATISAFDAFSNLVINFTGTVSLYSAPSNSVVPIVSDNFTNGIWNGNVAVLNRATNAVLVADDGNGHLGLSNPFDLVPANMAPVILLQPTDQTVFVGGSAAFSVVADGTPPLNFQWSFNGTNLIGATNTTLTLANVQFSQAGNYAVLVTNSYGSVLSSNAVLTVNLPPPCAPAPSGLVGWWPAEGNANDIAGTNNGILQGPVSFAGGEVGQAFVFDGFSTSIRVPASSSLDVGLGGGLTTEVWINPLDFSLQEICEWNQNGQIGAHLELNEYYANGSLWGNIIDTSGNAHVVNSAGGVITTNSWQHVAMTYDKASGVAVLYCNGAVVATANLGVFTPQTSFDFYMGNRPSGPFAGLYFKGQMDESSVYNRALTASEIQSIYAAGSGGKCPLNSPVIISQPTNQMVTVGGMASFSVTASGTAPLSYQWAFNGTNFDGATNTSLTLTNVQFSQAGDYAVVVTNTYGSVLSSNAVLTVNPASPGVPVITGFNPISGVVGTNVAIFGTNFSPVASNNIVYFGAVQATVIAASVTNLTVTVPVGATYAPITETVNGLVAYANTAFEPTFLGDDSDIGPSSFAPRVDLAGGSGSYLTMIADLDGDGKPDLVVANGYDQNLSLFRNISTNGTLSVNSFAPRVELPALGGGPNGLAVADVDGDGKLDIVTCDGINNQVVIFRNISTVGTLTTNSFAPPVVFNVGATPLYARVRDLDGDGRPDIACVSYGENTLSILRNIGVAGDLTTNSFAPRVVLVTGSSPHDLVIADLDGDGKPDLAQVNYTPSFLSVFRNISVPGIIDTNSFAARVDFAASGMGDSIIAGDVDGDGKVDLVVGWAIGSAVAVYRNLASPGSLDTNSFAPEVDFPAPGWVRSVAMGDMNGDGKPDISLTCEVDSFMCIYQNVSTPGSFTNTSLAGRVDYGAGWNPHGESIGDLDGDGRPDIVFGNTYDSTISIYRNVMPFGGAPIITTQPTNQTAVVGGTAIFNVMVTGSLPLSYQWNFNGTNIVGATNSTLTLANVQFSQAGNYAVLVTNAYGSVLSSNAVLTVNLPPPCAPGLSGLVGWWPGAGNANDIAGTNNGTLVNGVSFVPGEVGQAFSFDGVSSYVSIPDSPSLDTFVSSITIETWIKMNQLTADWNWEGIVTKGNSSWRLQVTAGAKTVTFSATGVSPNGDLYGSRNVYDGQWHHVAAVYDGTNMFLYVDGTLDVSQPATGSISQNSYPGCIGENAEAPGLLFKGMIDEVSIYKRALTASEIQLIYATGSGGKCPLTLPVIDSQPTNQTVAVGGTVNFNVTASGALPLSYQWNFNGTNIVEATNATLTLTNVQLSQAGNYSVQVTNFFGSILSSNAVLVVTLDHFAWNPIPSPRFVNTPFSVIIRAQDMTNGLFTNFTGTAILGTTNGVAVTPPVSGNFVQGVWTGSVVIAQTASNLVLQADDGLGHFGLANPINVLSLPRLGMLHSGNIALFMWPVSYSGFVLETSGNLSPATWVVVPYSPIQIGDQYLLPLDMTGTNGFYRLRFPGP